MTRAITTVTATPPANAAPPARPPPSTRARTHALPTAGLAGGAAAAGRVAEPQPLEGGPGAEGRGDNRDEAGGGVLDGDDPRAPGEGEEVVEGVERVADLVARDAGLPGEPAELLVLAVGEVE